MIQLLFFLIFLEMGLIVSFVFKTPLRKLVIMCIDRLKRGRGPIVVKTVSGTVFVVMSATVYNVVGIQKRFIQENGEVNSTDQILFSKHLLEASLMGFSLFLGLMIDRLHHYIRELRIRRKTMEAVKKQNRVADDVKPLVSGETKAFEEITILRDKVKLLETQLEEKSKNAGSAKSHAEALQKQSEGFLVEYERLLDENQNLRSQLQSLDLMLSNSNDKKSM